jgi:hypothetical protein
VFSLRPFREETVHDLSVEVVHLLCCLAARDKVAHEHLPVSGQPDHLHLSDNHPGSHRPLLCLHIFAVKHRARLMFEETVRGQSCFEIMTMMIKITMMIEITTPATMGAI